jgi:hypothetical protein
MSTTEIEYLGHPARMDDSAEFPHPPPSEGPAPVCWGDTMWVSLIDPDAGIYGANHIYLTNRGMGRFQSHCWIDGVQQTWGRTAPVTLDPALTKWSDGNLTYEVLEPFKRLRLTMDNPLFGFDVEYTARGPIFDYEDCAGGNPLWVLAPVAGHHGGHFEQALTCRGRFEIRGGPAAGQVRRIDSLAHRDRTWSNRFSNPFPWEGTDSMPDAAMHFWLIMMFPERDVHGMGFFDPAALGLSDQGHGRRGYVGTDHGNQRVLDVTPVDWDGKASALRTGPGPRRWRFELDGGETLHVRATRHIGTIELWMRGVNDLENTLNDYEDLVDLEIEETGEQGYGIVEYSVLPPRPHFVY